MNKLIVGGNLGSDAELKQVGDNDVLNFSVALGIHQGGGREPMTVWVGCALWGKRAATLEEYLTKGTRVVVSGRLRPSPVEGTKGYYINMDVDEVFFAGNRDSGEEEGEAPPRRASPGVKKFVENTKAKKSKRDGLPF